MKLNEKLKYSVLVLILLLTFSVKSQEKFVSFLKQAELPSCFANLEPIHIDELYRYGKTSFKSFEISSHYNKETEVFTLKTKENCHNTREIQLKHVGIRAKKLLFLGLSYLM